MRLLAITVAAVAFAAAAETPPPKVDSLAWMSGSWQDVSDTRHVSEAWLGPRGGMMVSANLSVAATGRAVFEYLRIADTPAGLSLFASPAGRPATEFKLKEAGEKRVVFENLEHAFPQRVIYWRDGEVLRARIEGVRNGSAASDEWSFVRAAR
jgi:hypothetical protein